MTVVSPTDVT